MDVVGRRTFDTTSSIVSVLHSARGAGSLQRLLGMGARAAGGQGKPSTQVPAFTSGRKETTASAPMWCFWEIGTRQGCVTERAGVAAALLWPGCRERLPGEASSSETKDEKDPVPDSGDTRCKACWEKSFSACSRNRRDQEDRVARGGGRRGRQGHLCGPCGALVRLCDTFGG